MNSAERSDRNILVDLANPGCHRCQQDRTAFLLLTAMEHRVPPAVKALPPALSGTAAAIRDLYVTALDHARHARWRDAAHPITDATTLLLQAILPEPDSPAPVRQPAWEAALTLQALSVALARIPSPADHRSHPAQASRDQLAAAEAAATAIALDPAAVAQALVFLDHPCGHNPVPALPPPHRPEAP